MINIYAFKLKSSEYDPSDARDTVLHIVGTKFNQVNLHVTVTTIHIHPTPHTIAHTLTHTIAHPHYHTQRKEKESRE